MELSKIYFLRWLPASWKSTWALDYVRKHPWTVRVNKDDLRAMMNDSKFSKENEEFVVRAQDSIILSAMRQWLDIIVDNTHISNPSHLEKIIQLVTDQNDDDYSPKYELIEKDFKTSVSECIERDKQRANPVWAGVIKRMNKSCHWGYTTLIPEEPREFSEVINNPSLPCAIIVDIDGTVAKMGNRNAYEYDKVSLDTPHEDIIKLINITAEAYNAKVIFLSGRSEDCREETEKWLNKYIFPYHKLLMRASWDTRKDSIIKREILDSQVINNYYVPFVFDDRNQVVKMWRESWLRCLQVANWNF